MTTENDHPTPEIAAEFEGLKVPRSPYLPEQRARQISRGNYEKPERKLSDKLIQPGDRVLEMGAGIGFVGGMSVLHKSGAVLRSFEANPDLIPHIQSLYQINGLADRASVENKLVIANPERPETMTFYVHGSFLGSSVYEARKSRRPSVEIPTISWDAVKSDFCPDVVIMDIEGAERDFVNHADLTGIRALIIEFHPALYGEDGIADCLNALKFKGFKQLHHRYEVRSFVREAADIPR